jgi:hypothetical protein
MSSLLISTVMVPLCRSSSVSRIRTGIEAWRCFVPAVPIRSLAPVKRVSSESSKKSSSSSLPSSVSSSSSSPQAACSAVAERDSGNSSIRISASAR